MPPVTLLLSHKAKVIEKIYLEYKDSGLGLILHQLIIKLDAIRKKYHSSKYGTPEEKEAFELLNAAHTILDILHQTVLPKFSKGMIPGLWSFLPSALSLLKLRSIKNSIFLRENQMILFLDDHLIEMVARAKAHGSETSMTQCIMDELENIKLNMEKQVQHIQGHPFETIFENLKSQIQALNLETHEHSSEEDIANLIINHLRIELIIPRHPMIYEWQETMIEMIRNAPLEISDLINFLNPAVVPELIKNITILGDELRKSGILSVQQMISHQDSAKHPYQYEVVSTDPYWQGPWDVEEIYIQSRSDLLNKMMIPATRRYLDKWSKNELVLHEHAHEAIASGMHRMKSDLAQAEVLQSFKDEEMASMDRLLNLSHQDTFLQWTNCEGVEGVEDLLQRLIMLETYLISQQRIQKALEEKRIAYAANTIDELLQEACQQKTRALINQHQDQGLDLAYCAQGLPLHHVYVSHGEQALPRSIALKQALMDRIHSDFKKLENHCLLIEKQIEQIIEQTVMVWKNEQSTHFHRWDDLQQQFFSWQEHVVEKTERSYVNYIEKQQSLQQQIQDFIASIRVAIPEVGMIQLKERFELELLKLEQQVHSFLEESKRSEQKAELELKSFLEEQEQVRFKEITEQNLRMLGPQQWEREIQSNKEELDEICSNLEIKQLEFEQMEKERCDVQANKMVVEDSIKNVEDELRRAQMLLERTQAFMNPLQAKKLTMEALLIPQDRRILYTKFQPILMKVKSILKNDLETQSSKEKPKLSFNQIDIEIAILKNGFHELLDLIHANAPIDKAACLDYRSRQNDFGRINPKPSEFQTMVQTLNAAIEATEKKIASALLTDRELCLKLKALNDELDLCLVQEDSLKQCQGALEEEQRKNRLDIDRFDALFAEKTSRIDDLQDEIQTLNHAKLILERHLTIHHQLIAWHDAMQALKLKLQAFKENGGAYLAQRIVDIKAAESALIEKLNEIRLQIPGLKEAESFTKRCAGMQQWLGQMSLELTSAIDMKLDNQVAHYEGLMADDKSSYHQLYQQSIQLKPEDVDVFVINCQELRTKCDLHQRNANGFMADFESVQAYLPPELFQRMQRLCESSSDSDLISVSMIDELLQKARATAKRIAYVQFSMNELDTYLRHRDKKHKMKDFFLSKDKKQRHSFVQDLKAILDRYQTTPDLDKHLLNIIHTKLPQFSGVGMRAVLSKITIALHDSKGKFLMEQNEVVRAQMHGNAKIILEKLEKSKPEYVRRIREIDQKIQQMKAYGASFSSKHDKKAAAVMTLASQLENEMDQFIVGHGVGLPEQELFDDFSQKFIATLHSRDDEINQHACEQWLNICVSILISILLIPQLIYSEIMTGRCSFFYVRTKKVEQLESIETSAEKLKAEYLKDKEPNDLDHILSTGLSHEGHC